MWQKLADFAKTLLSYGEMLQQNRADIRELQQEVRTLSTALQLLTREVQHSRETQRHEAELLKLQLDNALLRFERRLPAPQDDQEM